MLGRLDFAQPVPSKYADHAEQNRMLLAPFFIRSGRNLAQLGAFLRTRLGGLVD